MFMTLSILSQYPMNITIGIYSLCKPISSIFRTPIYTKFVLICIPFFHTECQCYDHADSCLYDIVLGHGRCVNCYHNTNGIRCELCVDTFYSNISLPLNDPNVCARKLLLAILMHLLGFTIQL